MIKELYIGLDVGSVSVNTYVTDKENRLLWEEYTRTAGLPFQTTFKVFRKIFEKFPGARVARLGITGNVSAELADLLGGCSVNEIVAHARAVVTHMPEVRTVIEMGGQDSKLLFFDHEEGESSLSDFSMNALCAAGTGSFLDQQAVRLGVSIEKEFADMALKCDSTPRIAGRCSVFAKSDMIHLQQVGTPVQDILSGLCHALARNFKATIGKGKEFTRPVAFQGGVAFNRAMIRSFEDVLNLESGELIIPEHHASMGAIGALILARESGEGNDFEGLDKLEQYLNREYRSDSNLKSLKSALTEKQEEPVEAYLGIDVGSISTNVVVIDEEHRVLAKRYLATASRPIEAISRGLKEIGEELGDKIVIRGAGTTGSGRYLSGDIIGADVVCNEITAQATAAIDIDENVDTIFEIGGQDSKYISVDNGAIVDFEMNKVCAAGTGSFLEEQAERFDIDLKTDFAELALNAKKPVPLGDRCTVFMETDLVHHQQAGADKGNLLAGLAYSTVYNYLNRVVGDKRVGKRIFFQGGTAFNKSVVAAFNRVLEREVIVPPHHEVTGAIGVATIAHRRRVEKPSSFKGFDLYKRNFALETFECKDCPNHCEIHVVRVDGERPLYYGSRCEKYDVDHSRKKNTGLPDLFKERERMLYEEMKKGVSGEQKGTVGIPMASIFYEQFPFWAAFFQSLGYELVISGKTSKDIINRGVEAVVSETCFPIKVAHGHVLALLEKKPDFIFLPSIIDAATPDHSGKDKSCFNCPYIQTLPYTIDAAFNLKECSTPFFTPHFYMQMGKKYMKKEAARYADFLKSRKGEIERAIEEAYRAREEFNSALSRRGREVLEQLTHNHRTIVIIGRPYNTCDSGVNLDLPKKMLNMNVLPIPMDMLPIDETPVNSEWKNMYWRYGQRILKAASIIRKHHNLYGLYVTNFGCGPDSFLIKFFARELGDKPFLQIEIDEHSADAGVITRCEAYLDTIASYNGSEPRKETRGPVITIGTQEPCRKIYFPYMCRHAYVMEALMKSEGMDAEVMDIPDEDSLYWGRKYTTGKECFPALLTTGDIVRQVKRPDFDPDRSAFFMASANGPCRFGQYITLQRNVLDSLGLKNVPVISLDQDVGYHKDIRGLSPSAMKTAFTGFSAVDVLERRLLSTRPYEKNPGETDAVFEEIMKGLRKTIENRGDIYDFLNRNVPQLDNVPVVDKGSKPLIGIVGEIYIRSNPTGNENLVRTLESMGAEVALPPISEWVNYVTLIRKKRNRQRGNIMDSMKDLMIEKYLYSIEKKTASKAGMKPEATPAELLDIASPYMHESFTGEAVLSIGKTIEYIVESGAAGVINVMPFTCMPGTIVTALLKKIHEDYDGFPCISLAYAGQQNLNIRTRLEAFMYQARENWKKNRAGKKRISI